MDIEKKADETREDMFVELSLEEGVFKTTTNKMYRQRKPWEPINPAILRSFMPGNIPEIFVKPGDKVKEGDKLLILEAMKMKNVIIAPFDGAVKAINVKLGDTVPKNFALLELE
ncbi:MAG: acetyl-CoA carboxylase biotin carboxyl carrier protein subunit [Bacteroidales bacterium]|mgnify:CR=1 FL=1